MGFLNHSTALVAFLAVLQPKPECGLTLEMGTGQGPLDAGEQQKAGQYERKSGTDCTVCFHLYLKGKVLKHRFIGKYPKGCPATEEICNTQIEELFLIYNPHFLFYYEKNKDDGPISKLKQQRPVPKGGTLYD